MSGNNAEEDNLLLKSLNDAGTPKKKLRLDNSGRKSWSLIDRRTDQEVLQEMGVSLLEPDEDCEAPLPQTQHKSTLKRKRDQENVNPNVNSVMSPKGRSPIKSPMKSPLKSPLKVCSPVPGPSRVRSPRSIEKYKPLQSCDVLETTLLTDYLIDEETPLNQVTVNTQYSGQSYIGATTNTSVTSSGGRRTCFTPLRIEEEQILKRLSEREPQGTDSFAVLSDEMMLSVFRWLPKRTLAHCMLVCKRQREVQWERLNLNRQWHQVACDETLWQRLDLGNKTLAKGALGRILSRKPIIVRLASSEIGEWRPTAPLQPSRIQYLDLSMCTVDRDTLSLLLSLCPLLAKLSLEAVSVDPNSIGMCPRLETLNLAMAKGIDAQGLDFILERCTNLQSLNISWCQLTAEALEVLVNGLPPRLQRLNLSGARVLTDDMLSTLVSRCPDLVELDLSDCPLLTGAALSALPALLRLEHLALSRCYLLPPYRLTSLKCITSLQYLEVWGMLQTASLSALKAALPAIQINQFMFSAIARPTVGTRRTSIWGLRTRD